jgi:putative membrane protein
MLTAAVNPSADPWAFSAHPQVWLLIASLVGAFVYAVRVLGPRAVAPGETIVSRRQVACFIGAISILWFGSDWPMHDISEEYLYSAHMLQHMLFSYFLPPLALLATPEWLLRILIGRGRAYAGLRWLTKPVVAGVTFNLVVMVTHIPGLVNRSAENSPLHYTLHVMLVSTALLMWMPIVGPFRELHMGWGAKMIYLFLQSVVPTVPAGWLTFAEGVVYKHHDIPVRVFGLSATDDQQIAGAVMKLGGATFLWIIVIWMFFKRFAARFNEDNTYRRSEHLPRAEITGHADLPLTYDEVSAAFDRSPAPDEPLKGTSQ